MSDKVDPRRTVGLIAILTPTLLSGLYFGHTIIYIWFGLPNSRGVIAPSWLAYCTGPTGVIILGATLWIYKRPVNQTVLERWLGGLCLLVILNITVHYTVAGDVWVSFTYGFVMMALGVAVTSLHWFVFLVVVASLGHLVGTHLSPSILASEWWMVIVLDLVFSMVAVVLFATRRSGLAKLDALREEASHRQAIADEALLQTERAHQDMKQLIELAPDAVLILMGDVIHYANSAFLESVRHTRENMVGKTIRELSEEGSIATDGPSRIVFQRSDGESILFRFSKVTNIRHEGMDATLLIGQDVTDRDADMQAKLQLADRMAAIGVLATGVAHEINNPLAYVMGNLAALQDQQAVFSEMMKAEDQVEFCELIEESLEGAERVASIVRDLNALARSSSEKKSASIADAVSSTLRIAEPHLKFNAKVVVDMGELPPVACSHSHLSQILLNLVINASHALVQNRTNTITIRGRMEDNDTVRIEVQDTGKGMTPETQRHLFEPFYTTKPVGDGTGLGLYYCMNEIKRADGDLSFTSTLGVGTTFVIHLPVDEDSVDPGTTPDIHEELPDLSILVIDDEPMVCRALERMLAGQNVRVANDALTGLGLLQHEHYDLIFCDLMMPEVSGRDLITRAERAIPGIGERFIFITGGAFTPDMVSFMETKKDQVLLKPFQLHDLRKSIRTRLTSDSSLAAIDSDSGLMGHSTKASWGLEAIRQKKSS